eukprot:CAMPEP_0119403948 /NCGR_PEP_ID=MMETSP1334-20130426/143646_1 /TAXON_ID=127549 /ORGANISM="Calcidiscus leptoporus, Strain RCC1130" /LENGTH=107 /DNA_ID=CAMNT_0007427901 /DNA_START=350 /DNA_END=670 /DNA_ORIENTATION=+
MNPEQWQTSSLTSFVKSFRWLRVAEKRKQPLHLCTAHQQSGEAHAQRGVTPLKLLRSALFLSERSSPSCVHRKTSAHESRTGRAALFACSRSLRPAYASSLHSRLPR